MKKRLLTISMVICFTMLTSLNSFAYLDPSTSTYIIQIVVGGIVAAGTAVGIFWYKIKKAVTKKGANAPAKSSTIDPAKEGKTLSAEDIMAMSEKK